METNVPPVNFPPNFNPAPIDVPLPANACDTHFHVWGPPERFPYATRRTYTPPACPIEHFVAIADMLGIQRGVLVQSNVHKGDNASTMDALEKYPDRLRAVIKHDRNLTKEELQHLDRIGVRGFRLNCLQRLSGGFDPEIFRQVCRVAGEMDWVVTLHLDTAMLIEIADQVANAPCKLAIDHLGESRDTTGTDWAGLPTLERLLSAEHVWLKASALDRRLRSGTPYEKLVELMSHLLGFRPDRILWGSDWPHSGHFAPGTTPDDGRMLNMWNDFTHDPVVIRKVFADNPQFLFRF
jgi:4-sulfomuconolactone hydrolase